MDKEKFILSTVRPMAEYTFPYLTSVIGVRDEVSGEHVGSGLRCVLDGRRAIVTAMHVVETGKQYPGGFAVSTGYASRPYRVHGQVQCNQAGDLALYYLPDDFPFSNADIAFWPQEMIEPSSDRLSTDYLFVHGFPAARSQFFQIVQGVASKSLPYGVMQRLGNLPEDLQSFQFALDFDPVDMHPTGPATGSDLFVDPHGLSGSPVWRIGISGGTAAAWKPDSSRVVGFATQWRTDEKILVASLASQLPTIQALSIPRRGRENNDLADQTSISV